MKHISITSELLDNYHRGLCSPREIAAVEQWLDGNEEELLNTSEPVHAKILGDELWNRIEADTVGKKLPPKVISYQYWGVAASLLLAVFLGYTSWKYTVSLASRNTNPTIVQHRINSLIFTALSDSPVSFSADTSRGINEVEFTKAMLIQNDGAEDVHLQVRISGSVGLQDFVCKKGISYVAVRLNTQDRQSIGKEMLWLEKDELWTIPPLEVISDFYKKLNELERIQKS